MTRNAANMGLSLPRVLPHRVVKVFNDYDHSGNKTELPSQSREDIFFAVSPYLSSQESHTGFDFRIEFDTIDESNHRLDMERRLFGVRKGIFGNRTPNQQSKTLDYVLFPPPTSDKIEITSGIIHPPKPNNHFKPTIHPNASPKPAECSPFHDYIDRLFDGISNGTDALIKSFGTETDALIKSLSKNVEPYPFFQTIIPF
jgi:hypothetical protein